MEGPLFSLKPLIIPTCLPGKTTLQKSSSQVEIFKKVEFHIDTGKLAIGNFPQKINL